MGLKYEPSLDGLRAVAAFMVLFHHALLPGFAGGGRGVDVFFVLSGYLITSLLLARPLAPVEFWLRRSRRLMPAMLAVLAAYVALAPLFIPADTTIRWRDALLSALYLLDFEQAFHNHETAVGHLWSLAVEAQFYLFWPLVLTRITAAKPRERLLILWAAMTVLRLALSVLSREPHMAYNLPIAHASGLVLGAALVFMPSRPWGAWGGLGLLALLPIANMPGAGLSLQITLAELATAALLLDLKEHRTPRLASALSWEPLRVLGLLSYGIYLWHFPLTRALPVDWPLRPLVVAAAATALAGISFVTVERWAKALLVGQIDERRGHLRGVGEV